jgi:hypothetical protein
MPSPLVYARPSGLFVRFLVPLDLRSRIGSQFIVRALGRIDRDTGRLLAALMGSALSSAYAVLRREPSMPIDIKELLRKAQAGELRDWTSGARVAHRPNPAPSCRGWESAEAKLIGPARARALRIRRRTGALPVNRHR